MSVEQLLRQALHRADTYRPSPDLFARVQRSIEEDRAHRRRVRLAGALVTLGVAAAVTYLALTGEVVAGRLVWPWWALEVFTTAVLAVAVVVLGPLIRRFGRLYAQSVFRANPPTAGRFLALLDIAYYLVFVAYILLTARFAPDPGWLGADGSAEHLRHVAWRIGELLLTMGVLHSLTIALLPLLGLAFAAGWRRPPPAGRPPHAEA